MENSVVFSNINAAMIDDNNLVISITFTGSIAQYSLRLLTRLERIFII